MWLLAPFKCARFKSEHFKRAPDDEATRSNDSSYVLNPCGMANFRNGDLARAEALLVKATKRLPKHPGLRENRAAIRAARNDS